MREFAGFATDAETARGWWIEPAELYLKHSANHGATFLTVAYGGENWGKKWEVGGDLGYGFGSNGDGLSDLELWAKMMAFTLGRLEVGGGLLASFPTSTGLLGKGGSYDFAPFVTGALPVGRVSLRASLGYVFIDGFFYDLAALTPITDRTDFRVELAGDFNNDFGGHNVSLLPGFDSRFPLGRWEMMVRVVGGVELTDITSNFTAGLSFAFTKGAGPASL